MMAQPTQAAAEGTRARILDAALDLFGERGLAGATVRDIAARAKVNVAAISYHFGGKEELYLAVAAMAGSWIEARIRARIAHLLQPRPLDREAGLAALETLLDAVVDLIAGPPDMRRVTRFIIREQMHPTEAFDAIFDSLSRVHAAACSFFAAATGRSPEDPETRLHVFMLLGQAQMLRIAEAAILRRMQIDHYDAAFLARVKALLRGNVRSIVAAASRGGGR
jgi:AcrR family transcriptional regulator